MAIYQVDNTINQIPLKNGYVYYISSVNNIKGILEHGFSATNSSKIEFSQSLNNKPLDEYISFYFNPRNSVLYSKQKTYGDDIVILEIKKDVLLLNNVIFTNKSVRASNFCFADDIKDLLNSSFISWDEVFATSWDDADENLIKEKQFKMMAEVLVPDMVPSAMIAGIVCQNPSACEKVARILNNNSINISWNSSLFFNVYSNNESFEFSTNNYYEPYKAYEQDNISFTQKNFKYRPQTKDELKALVDDESIYLGDIDTSAITDMSKLFFQGCYLRYEPKKNYRENFDGIEFWNVENVTNMEQMFKGCIHFNKPLNMWNVSNVANMKEIFYKCESFNQPLDSWNVSNVDNMRGIFNGCKNFNQPLKTWDISNVTDVSWMFHNCDNFNQPLNDWNVSNVTDMSYMFSNCKDFNQPLNDWNVSNVTNMSWMFSECKNFNQLLNSWNIDNVTDMSYMFCGCDNFNKNLLSWSINNATKTEHMFAKFLYGVSARKENLTYNNSASLKNNNKIWVN